MHVRSLVPALALALSASGGALAQPAEQVRFDGGFPVTTRKKIYPLSEVERGDKGVGYTVLAEDRVTEFGAEVLGVLPSLLGPDKPVILAKLTGEAIEFTGVIAGMSGSPVYIDGRLVGAVAYRFGAFSREPIAGITPIESMLDVYSEQVAPRGPTAKPISVTGIDTTSLRSRELLPAPPLGERFSVAGPYDPSPIDTPIAIAGALPRVAEALGQRLEGAGFSATVSGIGFHARKSEAREVMENAADQAGRVRSARIAPGSPIAALLMRGDIDVAAIGTVTMVEGQTVYGFGHPFVGWGRVAFPMATAAILNTLASPAGSYKQGIAAREVGSITEDRLTAIAGRIGDVAPMVPVRIRVEHSLGGDDVHAETTNVEIVDDQTWLPNMAEAAVANAGARRIGFEAGGTVDMDVRIHVGDRTLRIVDTYSAEAPVPVVLYAARDVANTLATIERNDVDRPEVTGVEAELDVRSEVAIAQLQELVPEKTVVRPGEALRVTARLRKHRGDYVSVPLSIPIPRDAAGELQIYVAGGIEMDRRIGRIYGVRRPTNLDALLGILAERRPARALFGVAIAKRKGVTADAELFEDLPPSAQAYMTSGRDRTTHTIKESVGEERRVPFSDVVVGGMAVSVTVVR